MIITFDAIQIRLGPVEHQRSTRPTAARVHVG